MRRPRSDRALLLLLSLVARCGGFAVPSAPHAVQRVLPASLAHAVLRVPPPFMASSVTVLNSENWEEELASCEGLAVVKFWAPWCRTCKAINPIFERIVFQTLDQQPHRVRFFQVSFKECPSLCYAQRIVALPTVHFYLGDIGRVSRLVVNAKNAQKNIKLELERCTVARTEPASWRCASRFGPATCGLHSPAAESLAHHRLQSSATTSGWRRYRRCSAVGARPSSVTPM